MNRMLGKLPAKHNPDALMLAAYLPAEELPVPAAVKNSARVKRWGMMMNDVAGDCTCAGVGHMIQAFTANNDNETVLSDQVIIGAYSLITGYDPSQTRPDGSNPTDQGAAEVDVLDFWMREGFGGHKLTEYALIEPSSEYQTKLAVWLFGGAYTGIALPRSAQGQKGWAVVPGPDAEPGSWGGHAVPILDYDAHRYGLVSWGELMQMTKGFWRKYGDEAYAPLSLDWINEASKEAPNHLKWDDLKADLEKCFRRAA